MFHPSTERLIDYWRDKKGESALPRRADINPGDFLELLPQVFVLGREGGKLPFRLAGGFVSDLHARDLRGQDALSLWALAHRLDAADPVAQPGERFQHRRHPRIADDEPQRLIDRVVDQAGLFTGEPPGSVFRTLEHEAGGGMNRRRVLSEFRAHLTRPHSQRGSAPGFIGVLGHNLAACSGGSGQRARSMPERA